MRFCNKTYRPQSGGNQAIAPHTSPRQIRQNFQPDPRNLIAINSSLRL
ncbi:MAG: hypothetical protein ACP5D7_17690 [Limnospira sp.]